MSGQRLQSKDLKLVDIFSHVENEKKANELSSDVLSKVKFIQKEKLIEYLGEISQDTERTVLELKIH